MDRPLVSIIVTNYNYCEYLDQSVNSALDQTYDNIEVVVVDDGSTDDSQRIIKGFGKRIKPVLKENGGHGSAANAGFAASSGDIIIFLDADDYLHSDTVEKVVKAWRPGTATVQYYLDLVDANGERLGERFPPFKLQNGDLKQVVLDCGYYPFAGTYASAYDRRVMDEIMPMPEDEWRAAIDYYHSHLCVFFGEVISLDESLASYRMHAVNESFERTGVTPEVLRKKMATHCAMLDAVARIGKRQGFTILEDLPLRTPHHVKHRLLSLRVDKANHPWPQDRPLALALAGIKASWKYKFHSLQKKIFVTFGFLAMAIVPLSLLKRGTNAIVLDNERSKTLTSIMR